MRTTSPLALLTANRAIRTFGYGFTSVLLGLYLRFLGGDAAVVVAALGLSLASGAALNVLVGYYGDRFGRRRVMVVMGLLMAVAGIGLASAPTFAIALLALATGAISPTGTEVGPFLAIEQSIVTEVAAKGRRTRAFAVYNLMGSLGAAAGALASGVPTLLLGAAPTTADPLRPMFLLYAVLGLVAAALSTRLPASVELDRREERRGRPPPPRPLLPPAPRQGGAGSPRGAAVAHPPIAITRPPPLRALRGGQLRGRFRDSELRVALVLHGVPGVPRVPAAALRRRRGALRAVLPGGVAAGGALRAPGDDGLHAHPFKPPPSAGADRPGVPRRRLPVPGQDGALPDGRPHAPGLPRRHRRSGGADRIERRHEHGAERRAGGGAVLLRGGGDVRGSQRPVLHRRRGEDPLRHRPLRRVPEGRARRGVTPPKPLKRPCHRSRGWSPSASTGCSPASPASRSSPRRAARSSSTWSDRTSEKASPRGRPWTASSAVAG